MDNERRRSLTDALFGPRADPGAWKREALALVDEILWAADAIRQAKEIGGETIVRTDARWKLLREIERVGYHESISDLAHFLKVSRQTAHELVQQAADAGEVRVTRNERNRRASLVELTRLGRGELECARGAKSFWAIVVFNGFRMRELRDAKNVLRALRNELTRMERQRHRAETRVGS